MSPRKRISPWRPSSATATEIFSFEVSRPTNTLLFCCMARPLCGRLGAGPSGATLAHRIVWTSHLRRQRTYGLALGEIGGLRPPCRISAVPFKANAARRHRIPKQRYQVTNWAEYDAALRQRGSLTVWFTEEAIAAWRAEPRTTRGGQPHYSALAIRTALMLRAVFRLALRQTEGLIGSILKLLDLDLAVPDHSTLSRRAETLEVPKPCPNSRGPVHLLVDSTCLRLCGPGEWLVEKHGTRRRRD